MRELVVDWPDDLLAFRDVQVNYPSSMGVQGRAASSIHGYSKENVSFLEQWKVDEQSKVFLRTLHVGSCSL